MLRDEIYKQKMQLVDTLQKISQAKIPAEDAFREMGEMLDKKLGQLLYLSRKLLAEACPHEIRCRTGQGLLQAHIETPDQLEAMLERLLAASCATGESVEYSQDVLWQHRIGGDDHEA